MEDHFAPAGMRRVGTALAVAMITVASLAVGPTAAADPGHVVGSLLERRHEKVVVQEWDLSCGAAALATLLQHQHGISITEREVALGLIGDDRYIADPSIIRQRHGFSLKDLKRYSDSLGFRAVAMGGLSYDNLMGQFPAMVPIRTNGYPHFVVVRGEMGGRVLIADPAFGTRSLTRDTFLRSWIDYGGRLGRVALTVRDANGNLPAGDLIPLPSDFVFFH